jgi:DNA-directed RNA polymerase subunit RPC12/RpoP
VAHPAAPLTRDVPSFDVADAVTPVGTAPCAECRGPIVDAYFEADDGVVCAGCHSRILAEVASRTTGGSFPRALGFGLGAAALGSTMYFAMLAATGREMSVVILLVALLVGKMVRVGARGRGGRRYQLLAVALTYLAIASTYVPFVLKGIGGASLGASVGSLGGLILLAIVAPMLEAPNHLLVVGIFALSLAQAWRMNRRTEPKFSGPYQVRATRG